MKKRLIVMASGIVIFAIIVIAALPAFKHHMEAVKCSNNMHAILFASALMWPDDHDGQLPSDFLSMSNELCNPSILICPSDFLRHPASSWAALTTNNCSYELLALGAHKGTNRIAILRCKIHGYVGYSDDTLLDSSGKLIRPQRVW